MIDPSDELNNDDGMNADGVFDYVMMICECVMVDCV